MYIGNYQNHLSNSSILIGLNPIYVCIYIQETYVCIQMVLVVDCICHIVRPRLLTADGARKENGAISVDGSSCWLLLPYQSRYMKPRSPQNLL